MLTTIKGKCEIVNLNTEECFRANNTFILKITI